MNMLKKSYFMTLLLAAVAVTGGKAQDASELVASQFNVNKDSQYHVFIKTYSQTLLNYLQEHPRITVDFTTDKNGKSIVFTTDVEAFFYNEGLLTWNKKKQEMS